MISIIGTNVNLLSYSDAARIILDWSIRGESRYVCAANVHMLMEAHDSPEFQTVLNQADLVTPDGMPLVWMIWLLWIQVMS